MNEHDRKQLETFRHFFKTAAGHDYMTMEGTHRTEGEIRQSEASRTRDEFILKFGTFPDESEILLHAARMWTAFDPSRKFDELPVSLRASWIRRAMLNLVTFADDLPRRLADATARKTIGVGLIDISNETIREGWVHGANTALHVPPRFWDEQYLVQNTRGMRAMLNEIAEPSEV